MASQEPRQGSHQRPRKRHHGDEEGAGDWRSRARRARGPAGRRPDRFDERKDDDAVAVPIAANSRTRRPHPGRRRGEQPPRRRYWCQAATARPATESRRRAHPATSEAATERPMHSENWLSAKPKARVATLGDRRAHRERAPRQGARRWRASTPGYRRGRGGGGRRRRRPRGSAAARRARRRAADQAQAIGARRPGSVHEVEAVGIVRLLASAAP